MQVGGVRSSTSSRISTRSIDSSPSPARHDDDARDLFDARHALEHLVDAVLAQDLHALRLGHSRYLIGTLALDREPTDRLADHHHLIHPHAALVAGVVAARAAHRLVERRPSPVVDRPRAGSRCFLSISWVGSYGSLHSLQSRRARRWASTQSTAEAVRKGSMPISVRRESAPGASLVCRVQSTRWPVSADSIAIWAVSRSRISPIMTMSGSQRRMDLQRRGEGQARLGVDLHLVDAGEPVLDRVLDGDDVLLGLVEDVERGVERGGLAGARGAGDQDGPVRLGERLLEALERLVREAQVLEAQHHVGLVEEAHDDLLAVDGRQRRHAHVDGLAADHEADATVLRDAALGDVQVGHDLEPREDARLHAPRDRHDLVQHAVDAEAHDQLLRLRLEVDVGSAVVGRLGDALLTSLTIGASSVDSRMSLTSRRRSARAAFSSSFSVTVESSLLSLAIGGEDVFFGGHRRLDVVAGHDAQVVDGEHVGRIDHRHLRGCASSTNASGRRRSGGRASPR